MFQNIIVTVVLVSIFHLSIAGDFINPGDINSFIKLANSTTENGVQSDNQDNAIDSLLQQMSTAVEWVDNVLNNSLKTFSTDIEIGRQADSKVQKLDRYRARIDGLFLRFRSYMNDYHEYNEYTINQFVTACTSNDTDGGLQDTLKNIYLLVMPSNVKNNPTNHLDSTNSSGVYGPNLFQYIQQILDKAPLENQCDRDTSVHQRLYETYNAIIITEAKGHIMGMFSYRLQKIKRSVSNEKEMKKAAANLVMRAKEYLLALKKSLPAASRTYRRCDPNQQLRGITFNELEGNIQLYLISEIDLNKRRSCSYDCTALSGQPRQSCDSNDHWCDSRPCEGYLQHCFSVDTSQVCPMDPDEVGRYQWFKNVDGSIYGANSDCRNEQKRAYGWQRGLYYCDMCACTCIEENRASTALRAFSMRPRLSNIDMNMVITGVKIVAVTRVIQIQIKQGKLLPNGRIDTRSEKWLKNERFEYTQNVYDGGFYLLKDGDEKERLKRNEDYSFIWSQQRILNLDELYWEPNYLVTGIKFGFSDPKKLDNLDRNLSPIQLEILVTEFDYDLGLLKTKSDYSLWITAKNMKGRVKEYDNERTEFPIYNLDNPVRNRVNVPDSTPNQHITFSTSDYWKDAGQSTVPFFDSVPVTGPSVPIAGIGLFHKGAPGYAGYISFRTYSVDLSDHMKSKMESNADMYKADFSDPIPYNEEVEE